MDLFLIDPEDLPFEERMKIKGGWPDRVSIANIGVACYPADIRAKGILINNIVKLCKSGKLKYYGDINGWEWGRFLYSDDSIVPVGMLENPYPGTDYAPISSGDLMQDIRSSGDKYRAYPSNCLIHKDEFNRYLQSVNQQVSGYLANWWGKPAKKKRNAGDQDKLRTAHAKDWVNRNEYTGGMYDVKIIEALQDEKQELWGNNETTFRKWIQLDEAKALFPNPRR